MNSHQRWVVQLVNDLTALVDPKNPNRAALAHLRRGLQATPDYTLARVGWLFRSVPDDHLEDALLAAGLFAWMKGDCPQRADVNFGAAFGSGLRHDEKTAREQRFIDLLDTDVDELPYKLRQAITLIGRDGVGLDWKLLIGHLGHWHHPDRWVQKEWARGFWGAVEREETADEPTTVESTTN